MILVIYYGGQYAHLICKRIRELSEYSELVEPKDALEVVKNKRPKGIILSGGPDSVDQLSVKLNSKLIMYCKETGIGILGICYGHQLLAKVLGGQIGKLLNAQYGKSTLEVLGGRLFRGLDQLEQVWMSHYDEVIKIPPSAKIIGRDTVCKFAAIEFTPLIMSVQFHPEVQHTRSGLEILGNFLRVCACERKWTPQGLVDSVVSYIKNKTNGDKVLIAVSGGVDSTVAAMACHLAIPDNLVCVFIDHQLLREGEAKEVCNLFQNVLKFKEFVYHPTQVFMNELKGVKKPEEKRKIIGATFMKVFNEIIINSYPDIKWLVQGTIYPDRVESGKEGGSIIKTHHNLVVPEGLEFGIIEPLKDLYKYEVRILGKSLKIPKNVILRQPFPGPGLAIRIIGEVTPKKVEIVRKADLILQEELKGSKLYKKIWQSYAGLLSSKTVGIKGDSRCYGYTIVIRIVESEDAMTAKLVRIEWDILERVTSRITNEIYEVTRVMLDLTSKPPGTIELI